MSMADITQPDKHLSFGGATGWHGPQTLPIHAPSVAGAVDKQCYDFGRRESLAGGSGACLARNESGMRELCLRLTLKRNYGTGAYLLLF
jgi:hypothetical protein